MNEKDFTCEHQIHRFILSKIIPINFISLEDLQNLKQTRNSTLTRKKNKNIKERSIKYEINQEIQKNTWKITNLSKPGGPGQDFQYLKN